MTASNPRNSELGTTEVLWDLTDLYGPDHQQLEADISWCQTEAVRLRQCYHGQLPGLSARDLFECVAQLEQLDCRLGKLATYAFLNFTTRMDNGEAGALHQRIAELSSQCGKETVFFQLEWNQLPEETAAVLLAAQELAPYRHYLQSMRRYLPHQLSEIEERLLLERQPVGRQSWNTLFDKIFAHLKIGEKARSEEEVLSDLYHDDRAVRQQAASELTGALRQHQHILTHVFNTLAAEKMISDRMRRHPSWLSAMNLDNQLQDQTVTTLVDAVCSRYDLVQRYYRLKQQLLSFDRLYDYDRYAPLPSLPAQQVSWNDCRQLVLDAFQQFSPKLHAIATQFFDRHFIHAPLQHGKRGGAFAHPSVPQAHPYVLVNYTGTLRDVSTVAHELGHGVHQVLAGRQGYYNSETPLVLAETASVFAELLVFSKQLEMIKNDEQKRAFICQKLESIFATVFRQTAMNRFEEKMHQGRRQQGELDSEQLSQYWLETQQQMFGSSVTLTSDYGLWWSYIPHFLATPGYVYSYAFGELLTLALYGRYQQEGPSFAGTYLQLLSAGGSQSPYALLEPLGFDLNSPIFWQNGLKVIEQFLSWVE